MSQPQGDRPGTAWRSLPALQRTIGTLQPVASNAAFEAGLASHHSPAFLAPLGHLVDPGGPSGEVGGLLRTATLPAVQRVAVDAGYPAADLEFVVRTRKLAASGRVPEPSRLVTAAEPPVVARLAAFDPVPLPISVPEQAPEQSDVSPASPDSQSWEPGPVSPESGPVPDQPSESMSPVSTPPVSISPVSTSPVSTSPVSTSPVPTTAVSPGPVSTPPVSIPPVSMLPVTIPSASVPDPGSSIPARRRGRIRRPAGAGIRPCRGRRAEQQRRDYAAIGPTGRGQWCGSVGSAGGPDRYSWPRPSRATVVPGHGGAPSVRRPGATTADAEARPGHRGLGCCDPDADADANVRPGHRGLGCCGPGADRGAGGDTLDPIGGRGGARRRYRRRPTGRRLRFVRRNPVHRADRRDARCPVTPACR